MSSISVEPQEANCSVSGSGDAPARRNRRENCSLIALMIDAARHKGTLIASMVFLRTLVTYETVATRGKESHWVSLLILSNCEDEKPYVYKGAKLRLSDGY